MVIPTQDQLNISVSLEVMKKRTAEKKGIACRFACSFVFVKQTILEYIVGDTQVIDLSDVIDKNELQTMIKNCYSKLKQRLILEN